MRRSTCSPTNRSKRLLSSLTLTVLTLWAGGETGVFAQGRRALRVTPPKPPFRVTPQTFEFNALPGQELPFEFVVEATERDVLLEVASVGLSQQLTGVIFPSETAGEVANVRLLAHNQLRVRRGESQTVQGRWRLPAGRAGFQTAGITLTDISPRVADAAPVATGQGAGAAVRFLSRYLVRMEAAVLGGPRGPTSIPNVVSAALVEQQGRAVATALLEADDAQGGVFRVEAQIRSEGGPVGRPFTMRLPTRLQTPGAKGQAVHVLAAHRVLVMAPVSEPLFAGRYELEVSVSRGAGPAVRRPFELVVGPDDFKGQQAVVAQVVRDLEVTPSQVELSTARGGTRLRPVTLHNRSDQKVTIHLGLPDRSDNAGDWLTIRPTDLVLRPRSKRQVLVAVRGGADRKRNEYAELQIDVTPSETTVGGSHRVPVALVTQDETPIDWRLDEPVWAPTPTGSNDPPVLTATLVNTGETHLAPHATLTLTDELDRQVTTEAGFGRWVMPGAEGVLRFPTPPMPAGEYSVVLEFTPQPGQPSESFASKLLVP